MQIGKTIQLKNKENVTMFRLLIKLNAMKYVIQKKNFHKKPHEIFVICLKIKTFKRF